MSTTPLATFDYYFQASLFPVIIVFGVLGNISNIYIFTRPALYRSCSIYFLAGAVTGLILLLFGSTTRWLGHTFPHLDATGYSPFFCCFRQYILNVIYSLSPSFTACVTVDRFCSSSANTQVRRLSARPRLAYTVVVIVLLITLIAYFHNLSYFTIIDSLCQPQPGFYAWFFPFFSTVYYFSAVSLIMTFGLGTISQVRTQRKKIQPMMIRINQIDRKKLRTDGQLLSILLVHVACYACFALPYHITLIVVAINPLIIFQPTFIFIQHIAIVALNFNQAIDCYVYTLTAKAYRKELIILFQRHFGRFQVERNNGQ